MGFIIDILLKNIFSVLSGGSGWQDEARFKPQLCGPVVEAWTLEWEVPGSNLPLDYGARLVIAV